MSKKLIVFDFDGTLVDSKEALSQGLIEFSNLRSLPYDVEKMHIGYVDPLNNDLGWGVPFEQQPVLLAEMIDYAARQSIDHQRLIPDFFPGAMDVLAELARIYDLALITARDRPSTEIILRHHDTAHYFPAIRTLCCARERGYDIKPAPDSLHCLLRDTKHDAKDVIVVGDTTSDILMANNAGAQSVAVLWGAHPKERLEEAKPTVMIDTITDLPEVVTDVFNL